MASEEYVDGLPFPILYMVHSVYEMEAEDGSSFMLHKDTGVPAQFPMSQADVIEEAFQIDSEGLTFSVNESSRGNIIVRESVFIDRIIYRGL